ncbi:SDR family oxidoreductase [Arsenicitalea aurantiaca]|uniref:SDR family oxidoreductase n=1 Tax=Arsenicitalea aurantiaca TaxID=1783274 RepID=A0A433XFU3_9HYPH|nr:SDR family NAD(P)-dependent oxidoreductase [Arsenicitalea aurantiaca]RUT32955.1 SDR family oxidoreductase [Arsenicitalea aurantiaca]
MEMDGKFAAITGAGSGLGEAAAVKLAQQGADIALIGRTEKELRQVAERIEAMGRRALVVTADVADEKAMRSGLKAISDEFGRIDFLFANAGVNGVWAPLDELPYEEWNRTMSINLGGTFLTIHTALPLMMKHGGSILITSSINGTRTFTTAGASAYATTKAGQLALGQMAAIELAKYKIRVNVICPGAIGTEISDNTDQRNVEKAAVAAEYPDGEIPLTAGTPGTSEDVANLVAFFASDRSRHITGTPVWIDGGQSLLV